MPRPSASTGNTRSRRPSLGKGPFLRAVKRRGDGSEERFPFTVPAIRSLEALELGRPVTIAANRGHALSTELVPAVFVTAHPSAILRAPDSAARARGRAQLVADLKQAAERAR